MNWRAFFSTQSIWGKVLGGIFGYLMTRSPVGAIIGILLGNFFDKGLAKHFSKPFWLFHQEKDASLREFYISHLFQVMGYLAKQDGRVSEREIDHAVLLMQKLELSKEMTTLAKQAFNQGKKPGFVLERILQELRTRCQHKPGLVHLFAEILYESIISYDSSSVKIQALNRVFTSLGFAPLDKQYRFYRDFDARVFRQDGASEQPQQQHRRHTYHTSAPSGSAVDKAYTLLGLDSSASKEEVKKAYRKAISKHHPDRLIAQKKAPYEIKAANEQTQRITKAYELICKARGWT